MSAQNLIETLQKRDVNLLISFIDSVFEKIEGAGDETALQEMLGMMVSATLPALIWERSDGKAKVVPIAPENLQELFSLAQIVRLSQLPAMPEAIGENLNEYLSFLPSYAPDLFDKNGKTVEGKEKAAKACQDQHDKMVGMFFTALES